MLMMRDKTRDDHASKPARIWTKPELVRLDPQSPKALQAMKRLGLGE